MWPLLWAGVWKRTPVVPASRSSSSGSTPAGQDFGFSVEMRNGDPDSLLQELEKYYEAYDSDYEAYLWIGTDGHGKNGAPYHIKDIVSDMEAAEAMIDTLYETLKTALK